MGVGLIHYLKETRPEAAAPKLQLACLRCFSMAQSTGKPPLYTGGLHTARQCAHIPDSSLIIFLQP